MALNYAQSLSPYPNKGKCGMVEIEESLEELNSKCKMLAEMISISNSIVAITGAGISTSCGIADFRGPNGIWTLEEKGLSSTSSDKVSIDNALPSYSHYALVELAKIGKLDFLISQNIDGLHMKSGFPMNRLAEVHGNMFTRKCNLCFAKHIKIKCSNTVGLKPTGEKCFREKPRGQCRGSLLDTILDWEDSLPAEDMKVSELVCKNSDLCLCLGTSLQIMPVGNYPLLTKKNLGKIVVINLQKTRLDKHADLVIHCKLDILFRILFEKFLSNEVKIPRPIQIVLKHENRDIHNKFLLDSYNTFIDNDYLSQESNGLLTKINK